MFVLLGLPYNAKILLKDGKENGPFALSYQGARPNLSIRRVKKMAEADYII